MQQHGYRPNQAFSHGNGKMGIKKLLLMVALVIITASAFVVISSYFDEERQAYKASENVFLDNITINGLNIGGMTYNDAWDALMRQAENASSTWSLDIACNGFTYATVHYNTVGIVTDYAQIEQLLLEAWQYGHGSFEKYKQDTAYLAQTPFVRTLAQPQGNSQQVDYILNIIADNVYRAPQDAMILSFNAANPSAPFVIQDGVAGQQIDMDAARTEIFARAYAGESGVYEIPLSIIEPNISRADIEKEVTLLAVGKNAIDKSSTEERTENIRLAFEKINGIVLQNGDAFSFNKIVGNRSAENGFLPALGYVSGELVEVIGGGVCQASTTLYSAALCAGMTITERTPHSMPVSYIELGQDATVNYVRGHMIDLKFENETGAPVYITASVEQNEAGRYMSVVRIFGRVQEDGVHYRLNSVVSETLPIPEEAVIRKDREGEYVKYSDQTYTYSKGREGYVVETYLQKLSGAEVLEETLVSTDTYHPQSVIQYVGVSKRSE